MSINLTVAVPLEAILAIQAAANTAQRNKAAFNPQVATAVAAAVETLPYRLQPKDSDRERITEDTSCSDEEFNIRIQPLGKPAFNLRVTSNYKVEKLKEMIEERIGYRMRVQRLRYAGNGLGAAPKDYLEDAETLEELGITQEGAIIQMSLQLTGS